MTLSEALRKHFEFTCPDAIEHAANVLISKLHEIDIIVVHRDSKSMLASVRTSIEVARDQNFVAVGATWNGDSSRSVRSVCAGLRYLGLIEEAKYVTKNAYDESRPRVFELVKEDPQFLGKYHILKTPPLRAIVPVTLKRKP